jgi:hypothetical protein
MGGGAGGGGFAPHGGFIARWQARRQVLAAVEADLRARGLPLPEKPLCATKIYTAGFASGLSLGLLIGLIFWELT